MRPEPGVFLPVETDIQGLLRPAFPGDDADLAAPFVEIAQAGFEKIMVVYGERHVDAMQARTVFLAQFTLRDTPFARAQPPGVAERIAVEMVQESRWCGRQVSAGGCGGCGTFNEQLPVKKMNAVNRLPATRITIINGEINKPPFKTIRPAHQVGLTAIHNDGFRHAR